MSDGYKLTIKTESPEAIKKLGGDSLFSMLGDMIHSVKNNMMDMPFMPSDSPFFSLKKNDFNIEDPIIDKFFGDGGFDLINKAKGMDSDKTHAHFVMCYQNLHNYRLANLRTNVRAAYNNLQNATNNNNDAVKMERVANKVENKSTGYWQIESLKAIDAAEKFASSTEKKTLRFARALTLRGEKTYLETAAELVKDIFELNTPKNNTRVAYTTLQTQDNEPYLMCPKGLYQGKHTVPMEVSKCRENCIDSRVAKDGTVTCAYQDWLKVAFEPHAKVMSRLDVHHSPDNEENALELKEGERSKKLTEDEFGYETRFDKSTQGANAVRGKQNLTESREKQLSDNKSTQWGHQEKETAKRPKQAQTDHAKVINDQLPRENQTGESFLAELLDKLNRKNKKSDHDNVREYQLDHDGLQAHRGEMDDSFANQLNEDWDEEPVNYRDVLNKDKEEPKDSIIHKLDKNISTAAKKKELSREELLEESRRNIKTDDTKEMQLKERRTYKSDRDIDKTIEALLEEEDYQEFSEKDLEHFATELGLDSYLEDKRNTYKLEP